MRTGGGPLSESKSLAVGVPCGAAWQLLHDQRHTAAVRQDASEFWAGREAHGSGVPEGQENRVEIDNCLHSPYTNLNYADTIDPTY